METSQQYVERLLGYLGEKDQFKVLSSTVKKIRKLVKKTKKKALYKKPEPNKWSVAEIVAHLAETELVMGWRYRSIAEKNEVRIQSFEQDDWAKNSRYEKSDIFVMLDLYETLRNANLSFIKGLPKEKLENFGMHEERGKETILHITRLEAGHDLNHLMQIERILKK
ncbi:MAG: DinB family protein [Ignavibacteriales bacterium]|nr:DinB family protein [Ignavibacteriales bacterium]